ncbi:molybdopterin-dependent oxidoreductase [Salinicola acroporae]|uniref:Molybdopterin oxidoreductase n=1 Tax=Salinicola acroporae TaxID=1541440 RepID=A0ABT6I8G9_9GAMM|nr:molybdopterin-dependent oxidoreductase [Salinicola acroporae]MDH4573777.1 molybdopterin oxidoreductase [Salinicola acroporae]
MAERRLEGYCTLCRSRCGTQTLVRDNTMISVSPAPEHPTGGALCAKGRAMPEIVANPNRLRAPLKRVSPKGTAKPQWQEISWSEALDEIATRLGTIRTSHGAESVAFAVTTPSGTPMVDSFEWVERFVRCFGSPNLIYAVEVCGWHKDHAHKLTFGQGIGFADYERADVIVLWGHNPARTWLAQASRIAAARSRGAKVVVIDPKPDGSGQQADLWLRVRPGTDSAIAMGAIRHLIATKTYDDAFVRRWTNACALVNRATGHLVRARSLWRGAAPDTLVVVDESGELRPFDPRHADTSADDLALRYQMTLSDLDGNKFQATTVFMLLEASSEPFTPSHVVEMCWVDPDPLEQFYTLLEHNPRLAYHAWTGVGQHTNATAIERAIASLYALTGACDAPGGNIWPTPPPTRSVNDYALLEPSQQRKALGLDELPLGPPANGWITARDFRRAVLEAHPYPIRALMSFGTNFVASQADAASNLRALHALDFHVHADIFMNPTAECADIVLPVNLPAERDALKIGFEIDQAAVETIQFRQKAIDCEFDARSDYDIALELATRLGHAEAFFNGDIETGWNWQLEPLGISVEQLRRCPGGKRFPQQAPLYKYRQSDSTDRLKGFPTESGLVELYSERLFDVHYPPVATHLESDAANESDNARYPLTLTTAKSGWFVHTSHRHIASLRKKSPDPGVEISPALASSRGLEEGDWAVIETNAGQAELRVKLNQRLDDRVVIAEFGWWQSSEAFNRPATPVAGPGTRNINAVLSDHARDPISGSVPLRAVSCQIRAHTSANAGNWGGWRDFTVTARRVESEDTVALELEPCNGQPLPAFLPGQYVPLRLDENGPTRAYSLTGSGLPAATLSIGVRRQGGDAGTQAGTSVSTAIHRLELGRRLQLGSPRGAFNPPTFATGRPLIFLAAGIGITPFVSVLARLACEGSTSDIHLLHGCRNSQAHPFARRLKALDAELPGLKRTSAYSAPLASDRLGEHFSHHGRIDFGSVASWVSRRPLVYICGSPAFTRAAKKAMQALGIPAFDIVAESFKSPATIPDGLESQTVRLAGSDREFVWRPEMGSLLDAATAHGISLPNGCRVGQCESCLCHIVSGKTAHLQETQLEENQCLTCQAIPLTPITLAV